MTFAIRANLLLDEWIAFARSASVVAVVNDIEIQRVPLFLLPTKEGVLPFGHVMRLEIDYPVKEGDIVLGRITCGECVVPSTGLTIYASVSIKGTLHVESV